MKAVFFDIGGVVLDDHRLWDRVFRHFKGIGREELWLAMNEEFQPACEGKQPLSESWRAIAHRFNVALDDEILKTLWIKGYEDLVEINEDVLAIVRDLRVHYPVIVVSNTIAEHADIARSMGIYDRFDEVVLSHEVGITKDDPGIFEIALSKRSLSAEEVVFIDDVEKYTEVAARIGIKILIFKDAVSLRKDLLELGIQLSCKEVDNK